MCNMMSGEDMPVGNTARGTTLDSRTTAEFLLGDEYQCEFVDTAGLNESDKGRVSGIEAMSKLFKLVKNSGEGYSLIIHVVRQGTIDRNLKENYDFFVQTVCGKKIPVVLVVTHCENVNPMSKWVRENISEFASEGLDYSKAVATCFNQDSQNPALEDVYKPLRLESYESVKEAIIEYSAKTPVRLYNNENERLNFIHKLWNKFCQVVDRPDWKKVKNITLKTFLMKVGFSENDAVELANEMAPHS